MRTTAVQVRICGLYPLLKVNGFSAIRSRFIFGELSDFVPTTAVIFYYACASTVCTYPMHVLKGLNIRTIDLFIISGYMLWHSHPMQMGSAQTASALGNNSETRPVSIGCII